jgi:hypothetical protein
MKHVTLMVATAALCISSTALSRPFFDPRSERSDAVESDAAFAAAPRDAACFAPKLVSTGGSAPANDAGFSGHTPLWRATEPVFQAIKDARPDIVTVSRGYREPVCFDTDINREHPERR